MEVRHYYAARYFYMFGMIFFGYLIIYFTEKVEYNKAFDPVYQTFLLHLGELLCIFFIFCEKSNKNKESQNLLIEAQLNATQDEPLITWHQRLGKYSYIIISFFEFANSFLEVLCFNFLTTASLASLQILTTIYILYYRIFHVYRKIFAHQKLGLSIFLTGMVLIIIEICVLNRESHKESEILIAVGLMVLAELFWALSIQASEIFMKRLDTSASEANTLKGLAGICICIVLYFPLGFLLQLVFPGSDFIGPFQLSIQELNPLFNVCLVISFCFSNYCEMRMLKLSESLSVCTVNAGRVIIVWVFHVIFYFGAIDLLEVVGAILVIGGLAIYNEIIVIPCFGLKKSVSDSIKHNGAYSDMKRKLEKNIIKPAFFLSPREINSLLKTTSE